MHQASNTIMYLISLKNDHGLTVITFAFRFICSKTMANTKLYGLATITTLYIYYIYTLNTLTMVFKVKLYKWQSNCQTHVYNTFTIKKTH